MKKTEHSFAGIQPFAVNISCVDIDAASPMNTHTNHMHDACEIYINLSGDVSFSVESSVYPIAPGDIIVTRPHEYHHCLYHSNKSHKHFWILFQPTGNEALLDIFFKRELGKNNLLLVDPETSEQIVQICNRLNQNDVDTLEKYLCFFKLIHLLNRAEAHSAPQNSGNSGIIKAIRYINAHLQASLSVKELAAVCNVSVSTLERQFGKSFNLSPLEYIQKKRLANAAKMLTEGHSVIETAYECGFSDCSRFINNFKKVYHVTPFCYKKQAAQNSNP